MCEMKTVVPTPGLNMVVCAPYETELGNQWEIVTRRWVVEFLGSCLLKGKKLVKNPDRELRPQEAFI